MPGVMLTNAMDPQFISKLCRRIPPIIDFGPNLPDKSRNVGIFVNERRPRQSEVCIDYSSLFLEIASYRQFEMIFIGLLLRCAGVLPKIEIFLRAGALLNGKIQCNQRR